ncbi:DMT family transporter [uncultured Chitinophaga sp.]|uniref:EamA family transporter n=1 Tax=uncultured Chitinophaga sp. TaxID=339340 RepID=UPI0025CDA58E|nr:DMT family transporter [uncultured Chitinophaga sp.]
MTKYILMVFAGACSFGILSTFVKIAYRQGYTPAEIAVSQAFVGMLALWGITLLTERKKWLLSWRNMWPLLLTGATIGITTFVYYLSVHYISASLAIVLLMQFTWISIVLERVLFGIKAGKALWWCTLAVLTGTVMAAGISGEASLTGVLLALGASVLYAIYIVANSRTDQQVPSFQRSAVMMTGSTLGIFLVNAPQLSTSVHYDWPLLPWAAFLALFGTIIPPVLFTKGIPRIGAGLSAIIMTAELPVAVICAHFVLHEPVSWLQASGIVVMLGAIAFMHLRAAGGK